MPDGCRVCEAPLTGLSRVPVCAECLRRSDPYVPEFSCVQCRTPFLNAFPLDDCGLCSLCRTGGTRFAAAYSGGAYEGGLRELIHLFKYGGVLSLGEPLCEMALRALPPGERFDLIVPAPMHWTRRWARGFNQAEILAGELSARLGIGMDAGALRKKSIPPQTGLTSRGRRLNVAGAVRASAALPARPRVLFVDDVYTTGATANACAQALMAAGASSVTVLTVARADRRHSAVPMDPEAKEEFLVCRA
jgi:ComF family protein